MYACNAWIGQLTAYAQDLVFAHTMDSWGAKIVAVEAAHEGSHRPDMHDDPHVM